MTITKSRWGNRAIFYYQFINMQVQSDRFYYFAHDEESRKVALKQVREFRDITKSCRQLSQSSFKLAKDKWKQWLENQPYAVRRARRTALDHTVVVGDDDDVEIEVEINTTLNLEEFETN